MLILNTFINFHETFLCFLAPTYASIIWYCCCNVPGVAKYSFASESISYFLFIFFVLIKKYVWRDFWEINWLLLIPHGQCQDCLNAFLKRLNFKISKIDILYLILTTHVQRLITQKLSFKRKMWILHCNIAHISQFYNSKSQIKWMKI